MALSRSAASVATVADEIQFFTSFTNASITHILLTNNLKLQPEFWAHSWSLINVTRSLVIEGTAQTKDSFVELDFSFISSKAALSDGVTVTFRRLSLYNAMSRMQLSYDFFVASPQASAVVWSEALNHLMLCMPVDFAVPAWRLIPRPLGYGNGSMDPPQNMSYSTERFCSSASGQCYSPVMMALDFAARSTLGYVMVQSDVMVICDGFVTQSCIDNLGPEVCYARTLQDVLAARQQQLTQQQTANTSSTRNESAGASSTGAQIGIIVGCTIGGAVFLAAALAAFLLFRRRQGAGRNPDRGPAGKDPSALLDTDWEAVAGSTGSGVDRSPAPKTDRHRAPGCAYEVVAPSLDTLGSSTEALDQCRPDVATAAHCAEGAPGVVAGAVATSKGKLTPIHGFPPASSTQPDAHTESPGASPFTSNQCGDVGAKAEGRAGWAAGRDADTCRTGLRHSHQAGGRADSTNTIAIATFGSALLSMLRSMVSSRDNASSNPGIHLGSNPYVGVVVESRLTEDGTAASAEILAALAVGAAGGQKTVAATASQEASERPAGRSRFLTHTGSFTVKQQEPDRAATSVPGTGTCGVVREAAAVEAAPRAYGMEETAGCATADDGSGNGSPNVTSSTPPPPGLRAGFANPSRDMPLIQMLMLEAAGASQATAATPGGKGDGSEERAAGGDAGEADGACVRKPPAMAHAAAGLVPGAAQAAEDVMLGQLIGSGSFGKVYKGSWRGSLVAVKVISHSPLNTLASIENELRLSMSFNHRNVVRALSYITCSVDTCGNPTITIQSAGAAGSVVSLPSGAQGKPPLEDDTWGAGADDTLSGTPRHCMIDALCTGRNPPHGGNGDGGDVAHVEGGRDLPRDTAETWVVQEYMARGTLSTYLKQGGLTCRTLVTCGPAGASWTRSAASLPPRLPGLAALDSHSCGHALGISAGRTNQVYFNSSQHNPVTSRSQGLAGGALSDAAGNDSAYPSTGDVEPFDGCKAATHQQGDEAAAAAGAGSPMATPAQLKEADGAGVVAMSPRHEPNPSAAPKAAAMDCQHQPQPMLPQERGQLEARPGSAALSFGPSVPDMRRVALCALDIARGLAYLHSRNVCHGDLKPGNILLAEDPDSPWGMVAKLADFGLSRAVGGDRTHLTTKTMGTLAYMCPLVLGSGKVSPSSCVYSFGIILWELVSGRPPYRGWLPGKIVKEVLVDGTRPDFTGIRGVPDWYSELAKLCWSKLVTERPTMDQVVAELEARLAESPLQQALPPPQ